MFGLFCCDFCNYLILTFLFVYVVFNLITLMVFELIATLPFKSAKNLAFEQITTNSDGNL